MSRINNCRTTSGISLAALAVSLLVAPQFAQAQSFNGTPTVEFGSVNITTPANTTNILVNSPRAVINWNLAAPSGAGPVIFQPNGTTANFISSPGLNYIVLNRIFPTDLTRAVQFNGTVNASGNNGVFFYSPGGIVLGNTAVFNVGRLLLTANDVAVDGNGGFFFANDLNLTAAAGSTAAVSITAGAQINALAEGSFVLAVAPRVLDSGTTVVNGTKALVAAEAVDLTYNAGLFDISVTQGTEYVGDALRHEGSTTGPASSGTGDFHRIYMVAVPKNTAISMFISGAAGLGFDVAGAADVIGNAIVLSGGSNITEASNGTGIPQPFAPFPVNTIAADIDLTQGNYTSAVNILSNNDARISTIIPGNINFASDLTMQAENNAILNITNGAVTVNGRMFISADAASPFADGSSQSAGTATVQISGAASSLTTNNFATITAQGYGANQVSVGNGGTGSGGTASVNITGGSWISNSGLRVQADGFGGNGNAGGGGIGGVASVTANNGSLQSLNGLELHADGTGGDGPQQGGAGTGGTANVIALGATGIVDVSAADGFFVTANGQGGFGSNTSIGIGGTATGGSVTVSASGSAQVRTAVLVNDIRADANGGVGAGGAGGNADAGSASIRAETSGQVRFTGTTSATTASASAISGSGTAGGSTSGGDVTITNLAGSTLLVESNAIQIRAYADGGAGAAGDGGSAAGGNVAANLFGTSTFSGATNFDAHGNGGTSVNATGGAGTGGTTQISSGGTTVFASTLNANSNGAGGNGTNGGLGTGGQTGGTRLLVQGGTMTASGAVLIDSSGFGGTGSGFGNGGGAVGGNSLVAVTSGTGTFNSMLNLNAIGTGGVGRNGGNAVGGAANVVLTGGGLGITGGASLTTNATGGNASAGLGGTGGDGTGGIVRFLVNNPATNLPLNAAFVSSSARGDGGNGGSASAALLVLGLPAVGGNGGNATGGTIDIGSANSAGNLNFGSVGVQTIAEGGEGGDGATFGSGGNGGNATGGIITVGLNALPATATGTFNAQSVVAIASAQAGNSGAGTVFGNGGNGAGGNIYLGNGSGGTVAVANFVSIVANGISGFGTVVGTADGGNAIIIASSNPNGGGSSFTAGSASLTANGLVGGAPFTPDLPTGRYGRVAIIANGGNVQLGATIMNQFGSAGQTIVPPAFGIINSGLLARNAQLLITNSFNGQFAGNAALGADGGNINFVGAIGNDFIFQTPGNIVDTLTGVAPTAQGQVTSTTTLNINAAGNILTPRNTYLSQLTTNIVAGGIMTVGGIGAGDYLFLQSGGNMFISDILSQDVLEAVSGGTITLGNIRADSDVDLTAAGAVQTGTISSGDTVTIGSGATISTGNIDAGINNPSADPAAAYAVGLRAVGTVSTGNITAVNRIGVGSETGSVFTGAINTGEFFLALAETGVTVNGGITTGVGANGITYIADASMLALIDPVTLDPAPIFAAVPVRLNGNVSISGNVTTGRFVSANTGTFFAEGAITAANADTAAGAALFISSGGDVTTQELTASAGAINVFSENDVVTGDMISAQDSTVTAVGSINTLNISAIGDVSLSAGTNITSLNIDAQRDVSLDAGGDILADNISALQLISIDSGGSTTAGDISTNDQLEAVSGGDLTVGNVNVDLETELTAANAISAGNIVTTARVNMLAGDAISSGDINAQQILIGSQNGAITTGAIAADQYFLALAETGVTVNGGITTGVGGNGIAYIADASMLTLIDPGTLDPAPVFAAAPVRLNGNIAITGPVSTGRFAAANSGTFTADGAIAAANGDTAGGAAFSLSSGGAVSAQNIITTTGGININGDAAISTAALNAETNVNFVGTGPVTTGGIISRGQVRLQTTGAITTGSIQANANVGLFTDASVTAGNILSNGNVEIGTGGNIAAGSIEAENSVKLISVSGAISTADIRSSQYFIALARTGVNIGGGITTGTGTDGVVYIANSSMANLIDPVTQNPAPLFNAAPVRLAGNVRIDGLVTTGRFVSGNTGAFTSNGAINAAASILISSSGLASFNGIAGAPGITLTSGGLDIGVNGGLGTASTAALNINAEPGVTAIRLGGDAGSGYVIDANEMARLRAQNIQFRTGGTAVPTITVSNFSLQGSATSESNLVGSSGAFAIETAGSVRIIGAAQVNNAAAGNAFSITAGARIDIVNDQDGAIRLGNPAGDPAGILNLTAGTVTSASDSLIGQLSTDPNFAGRNAALDAAAATPLAQGYLGAGRMNISVSNGLFIQNSNTVPSPGGFNVGTGGFNVIVPASANGPVNLVVNGRALLANGTFLSGKDTLGAASFTPLTSFAEGATLNGCLITGAPCGTVTPENDFGFIATQQGNAIENNDEDEELALAGEALPIVLIESLVTNPADEAPPRITEPVTGSGNSEAWAGPTTDSGEQP